MQLPRQQHWAALDLGSNTTMLLVAHEADGDLVEDREWYAATRLGAGLQHSPDLAEPAMAATLAAARRQLREACQAYPAVAVTAVATSAVRRARNGTTFRERCRRELGLLPRLLQGSEEAETVFLGVSSDRDPAEYIVHIDIGGGSSEITAGRRGQCLFSQSVELGCVGLGAGFGLDKAAPSMAVSRGRTAAAMALEPTCTALEQALDKAGAPPVTVLCTGGTGTTFASLQLGLTTYCRERVHGFVGSLEQLHETAAALAALPPAVRAQRPGLPPDRAAVLPAGLLILEAFLNHLQAASFSVSTRGLRVGLIEVMRRGLLHPADYRCPT